MFSLCFDGEYFKKRYESKYRPNCYRYRIQEIINTIYASKKKKSTSNIGIHFKGALMGCFHLRHLASCLFFSSLSRVLSADSEMI